MPRSCGVILSKADQRMCNVEVSRWYCGERLECSVNRHCRGVVQSAGVGGWGLERVAGEYNVECGVGGHIAAGECSVDPGERATIVLMVEEEQTM